MPAKRLRSSILQFAKFNLVGLANTAVDVALFAVFSALGIGNALAQTLSYSAGMVNSYLLNTRYTFRDQQVKGISHLFDSRRLIRFVVLNLIVLAVSVVLLKIFVATIGIPVLIAKLGVTCITLVLNFLGSRLWVYKQVRYLSGGEQP